MMMNRPVITATTRDDLVHGDVPRISDLHSPVDDRRLVIVPGAIGPNRYALGTPGEARRDRAARIQEHHDRIARPLLVLLMIAAAFVIGLNMRHRGDGAIGFEAARAKYGAATRPICVQDRIEKCLTCYHNDGRGRFIRAAHC